MLNGRICNHILGVKGLIYYNRELDEGELIVLT